MLVSPSATTFNQQYNQAKKNKANQNTKLYIAKLPAHNSNQQNSIAFKGVIDSGFGGLQKILDTTESAKDKIDGIGFWIGLFVDKDEEKRKIEEAEAQQIKGYAIAQQEIVKLLEQQSKEAEERLKEAQKNKENEARIRELELQAQKADKTLAIQKELMVTRKNKGWDRIAGYEEEKEILTAGFIQAVGLERAGNKEIALPNGILFFGPTGNGKTTFAKAFAEQAQCPLVEIDMMDTKNFKENLMKAAEESLKTYEKENKRTIILLDEFESVGLKKEFGGDPVTIPALKSFMTNCAEKYKCTLFLTTNNPLDIEPILLVDERTPIKVFLDPPNKENASKVFKHYTGTKTSQSIDHDRLADEAVKVQPQKAYSCSRIKTSMEKTYKDCELAGKEMTEDDVIQQLVALPPDILEEHMKKYEEEKNSPQLR